MSRRPQFVVRERRSLSEIRATIAALPRVDVEHSASSMRAHPDTFDGRLGTNQLTLEVDELGERSILTLRHTDTEVVEWTVEMGCRPVFARDFATPRIRRQLARLILTRALLYDFSLDLESTVFCVRDDRDKIIGRIVLEYYPELPTTGDETGLTIIRVRPLKGYAGEAQTIIGLLEKHIALDDCAHDVGAVVRRAAKFPVCDYQAKPVVTLDPGLNARVAVARVLESYRAVMGANESGMTKDIDIEFLHDFRVATRRSRSVLNSFRVLFPTRIQRRFKRDFAWLNRATGKHRDLDVFLLKLGTYEQVLEPDTARGLRPLRELLQRERRREHTKLVRALKSNRYAVFRTDWAATLAQLAGVLQHSATPPFIDAAASTAIWRMYRRVRKQCHSTVDIAHLGVMHELRKDCKKLRYLIESFQSIYPSILIRQAVGELKALQEALGDLCDIYVQCALLEQWGRRVDHEKTDGAALDRALDELTLSLNTQGAVLAVDLQGQLQRFDRASNRRLYRQTFRPTER